MKKKKGGETNVIPLRKRGPDHPKACEHSERLIVLLPRISEEIPMLAADIKKLKARIIAVGNQLYGCEHLRPNIAARDRIIIVDSIITDIEMMQDWLASELELFYHELNAK